MIKDTFDTRDMGNLNNFLGVKIEYFEQVKICIGQLMLTQEIQLRSFLWRIRNPWQRPLALASLLNLTKQTDLLIKRCIKHIDMKYHYIRDQVKANEIELKYCRSEDTITKEIGRLQFKKLRRMMKFKKFTDCEWGGVLKLCTLAVWKHSRTFRIMKKFRVHSRTLENILECQNNIRYKQWQLLDLQWCT